MVPFMTSLAMMAPRCVAGSFDGRTITTDPETEELGELVMREVAVVVKGVFESCSDDLLELRDRVFEWAGSVSPLPVPDPLENCHCLQAGVSHFQKTPHVFHSYNFPRP